MSVPPRQASPGSGLAALKTGVDSMAAVIDDLNASLVERSTEIELAMVALAAQQHLLLLGPPGTAKSLIAAYVGRAVGGKFFQVLLTRFTAPDEVFGPISVPRLVNEEKYERKTDRYLPDADVAFADEIYKASSAILNSLLTIINERVYDNGGNRTRVPLQTLFAASNELPQEESLAALHDRFLIRHEVQPVSNPLALLQVFPQPKAKLVNLDVIQRAVPRVVIPPAVQAQMLDLKKACAAKGASIGDRRFRESASLVRAATLLGGRPEATSADLWVLAYCYWQTPDQIPFVHGLVHDATNITPASPRRAAAPPSPSPAQPTQRPGGNGANRPAQAPTPPVTQSSVPDMVPLLQYTADKLTRGHPAANAIDPKLHAAIEALITVHSPLVDAVERNKLVGWKHSLVAAGNKWLA